MFKLFIFAVAITAVASEVRWEGLTRFSTISGLTCITPCEKRGEPYYWCYVREERAGFSNTHGHWDICSPSPNTDKYGRPCETECKEHYAGSTEYGCMVDRGRNWERCGKTLRGPDQTVIGKHMTRYGDHCISPCEKNGHGYFWCFKENGGWDYCSKNPGYDVNNRKCVNTCDYHGQDYTWCNIESGGWDYCGTVVVDSETEMTYLGSKCVTPCKLRADNTMNSCYDASRRELACSRVHGVAANNKECNGPCGTNDFRGKSEPYYWCWTDVSQTNSSFCSKIAEDPRPRHGISPSWWTRRVDFPKDEIRTQLTRTNDLNNIFRFKDEQGKNQVTFYEKLERNGGERFYSIKDNKAMLGWFTQCLLNWNGDNSTLLDRRGKASLTQAGAGQRGIRLEQERFNDENRQATLTLKMVVYGVGWTELGGRSTTVAELQLPVDVAKKSPGEVYNGLALSLHDGYAVHIGRFNYEYGGSRRIQN